MLCADYQRGALVCAGGGAVLLVGTFQRVKLHERRGTPAHRSVFVRLRSPPIWVCKSSIFISDLFYPMSPTELMARDQEPCTSHRFRDTMFQLSDTLVAMLDFVLGLVYGVLDSWYSGWCDSSGMPLCSSPAALKSAIRDNSGPGSNAGDASVADISPAVKQDLAKLFYRPRMASLVDRKGELKVWRSIGVHVEGSPLEACLDDAAHGVGGERTAENVQEVSEPGPIARETWKSGMRGLKTFSSSASSCCRTTKFWSTTLTSCTCWGWHLEQVLTSPRSGRLRGGENNCRDWEERVSTESDSEIERAEAPSLKQMLRQVVLDEHRKSGWSECQCEECMSVLMPLELALERLYVRTCEAEAASRPTAVANSEPGSAEDSDDDGRDMGFSNQGSSESDPDTDSDSTSGSDTYRPTAMTAANGVMRDVADDFRIMPVSSTLKSVASIQPKPTSAVIFLHGIYSSSTFWFETLIPHLSAEITSRHQILVPDLLGCGRSPRPVDCLYTLEEQVDSIHKSVLERHDLESFHIVSHSMGTVVALALAARFPDRVRSVTMIAPLYGGRGDWGSVQDNPLPPCEAIMGLTKPWTLKGIKAIAGKDYYNVSRLIAHILFTRHKFWVPIMHRYLKRYPVSFIEGYFRNSHHATWHMSHNTLLSGAHTMARSLTKLRQRGKQVLVIHGNVDTTCFHTQSLEMSLHFDNVRLVTCPGKGHVDVIFGSEQQVLQHIESEILMGDSRWPAPSPPSRPGRTPVRSKAASKHEP